MELTLTTRTVRAGDLFAVAKRRGRMQLGEVKVTYMRLRM